MLQHIGEVAKKYDLIIGNVFHAGDGNLHPLILFDMRDAEQFERVLAASRDILQFCIDVGGSITGEHGVGMEKRDMMPLLFTDEELDVMISLRNAFNGDEVLNPEKMLPMPRMCREIWARRATPCWRRRACEHCRLRPRASRRELREICGAGHVIEDPAKLEQAQILGVTPAVAVEHRRRAEEVAAVLRFRQSSAA